MIFVESPTYYGEPSFVKNNELVLIIAYDTVGGGPGAVSTVTANGQDLGIGVAASGQSGSLVAQACSLGRPTVKRFTERPIMLTTTVRSAPNSRKTKKTRSM